MSYLKFTGPPNHVISILYLFWKFFNYYLFDSVSFTFQFLLEIEDLDRLYHFTLCLSLLSSLSLNIIFWIIFCSYLFHFSSFQLCVWVHSSQPASVAYQDAFSNAWRNCSLSQPGHCRWPLVGGHHRCQWAFLGTQHITSKTAVIWPRWWAVLN